jgi:E-phenylitaconyl-CoA hydratase
MDEVQFERGGKDDRIATITIIRPEAMNAMTPAMYAEITDRLREIDSDDDIWCGIVTGTGRAFTAGADLKVMHQPSTSQRGGLSWSPSRQRRFDNDVAVQKPLIAAVNGYCLAGGMELAEFCDIRIASTQAQFGAPEVKWSILHGYGALRLPGMVGMSDAMLMLLTGDFIDAAEALRIGLVSEVVEPDELLPEAQSIAERICANGPVAVRMTKELARRSGEVSLQDGLRIYQEFTRLVHMTADSVEGGRAFAEKRDAEFKNR